MPLPAEYRPWLTSCQRPFQSSTANRAIFNFKRRRRPGRALYIATESSMRIVFVTTEVAPWSKVGGLADVLSALPIALAAQGHNVMTIAPRYAEYKDVPAANISVPLDLPCLGTHSSSLLTEQDYIDPAASTEPSDSFLLPETTTTANQDKANSLPAYAELYTTRLEGVDRVFVDHPLLRLTDIYGATSSATGKALTYVEAGEFSELDVRYSVLCQAALAAPVLLRENPIDAGDEQIVFVANDWPTSLLPVRLTYALRAATRDNQTAIDDLATATESELLQMLLQEELANAVTVFCIHNMAYQGTFSGAAFERLCLPRTALHPLDTSSDWRLALEEEEQEDNVVDSTTRLNGSSNTTTNISNINFMRGALLTSDILTTVSPNYAKELCNDERSSACGFKDILSTRGVTGIMNGIDTVEWDPETDVLLPLEGRYSVDNVVENKAYMKRLLQIKLGLEQKPGVPLIAFIGRLTQQKGADVILAALPGLLIPPLPPRPIATGTSRNNDESSSREYKNNITPSMSPSSTNQPNLALITNASSSRWMSVPPSLSSSPPLQKQHQKVSDNCQFAMLGTGEAWMEAAFTGLQHSFPGQAVGIPQFSEELAHWILAAADYVLIPSRFEPCGLVAQCGVRYGAVPIVTAVGGLKDLVIPDVVGYIVPPLGNDGDRQDVEQLMSVIKLASREYKSEKYLRMQRTCMEMDLSWDRPAAEWAVLLEQLCADQPSNKKIS